MGNDGRVLMRRRGASARWLACFALPLWAACHAHHASAPGAKPHPEADSGMSIDVDAGPDAGNGNLPGLIDAFDASVPITLIVSPDGSTSKIDLSDTQPPIQFTAQLSDGSASNTDLHWSSDPMELGTIDAVSGAFTPSGIAGTVTVRVNTGALFTSTLLTIAVNAKQEGDPDATDMPAGAGGLGGVGGEGGGTAIGDKTLRDALDQPPAIDSELIWLYPYDGTVWPRALPAPLLQWKHGAHVPVAVKVHLQVDQAFTYDGYFGPPKALAAGQPIDRLPIPQTVWRRALQSGATMKVVLTVAASDGASGYKTYTSAMNPSWTISRAALKGVVYYNSYGTRLAQNFSGGKGGDGRFGGATLAITGDAYDPKLVAGTTTTDSSGCRVCHSVSADGSRMIAQESDNMASSSYDLKNNNKEGTYTSADRGKFGWAALSPDGTLALGNAGPPGSNSSNTASLGTSGLYNVSDGKVLATSGLSSFVTQAATPAFSPDGQKVAFNFFTGPGDGTIMGDGYGLVVMDFANDGNDSYAFTNPRRVFASKGGDQRPAWPFFLPDGSGLVFELELKGSGGDERFVTRTGSRGELWWTDFDGHAQPLDRANGKGYLPVGTLNHDDDATLQYEPTVAPIVAGGYAWVVFTSRRLYGNVATRDPFESDPREVDLTEGNAGGPTTKKLWVSAIDVPAKPGSDPSHPAFYLPAQELFAGNSRGFWVLEACHANNDACAGGDECCGGYCRMLEEFDYAVCTDAPPGSCAKEYDNCNVDADCCRTPGVSLSCIAGHCAQLNLQ
jgi:hypothetical protein